MVEVLDQAGLDLCRPGSKCSLAAPIPSGAVWFLVNEQ